MLLLFSLWSVTWGEMLQSFRPLALVLVSAQSKCSARVQSEGGQEGSFGPSLLEVVKVSEATNLDTSQFHFSLRHWTV